LGVEEWRSARSLTGAAIAKAVSELATNDVRLFVDVGNVAGWFIRHFNVVGARRFFINLGAGCMGHSVAAAIGASLADPTTRTIAIIGDAAFAMYGAELHVAAEHQLPITVIVVNDGGHGMISHGERLIGSEVSPTRFARPIDFASLARGYRVDACTVATPNELAQALTTSVVGPLLIDARIGRDEVPEALQTRADNVRKMLKNSRGES